jgi:hypothetical protein
MFKSEMVVLTGRGKNDVVVGWKLQPAVKIGVDEREREKWRGISKSEIHTDDH